MSRDKKRNWCVYIHTNKTNGKVYIGITSNSLNRRWGKNGSRYSGQKKFWNAIKKYGWDNFRHEVICANLTQEEASLMEEQYIIMFNSIENGYNARSGGCFFTEEYIEQIRSSNTNREFTDEHKKNISEGKTCKRPIICLETQKIYNNPRECAEENGISIGYLFDVCRGRILTTGNKHYQYADEPIRDINEIESKRKTKGEKSVKCLETGEVFPSIYKCAQSIGATKSQVRRACNNHGRVKGNHYVLLNDTNPTSKKQPKKRECSTVYCEELDKTFNSVAECAEYIGVGVDAIRSHCKNHKPINGYTIKYLVKKPLCQKIFCKTDNIIFQSKQECANHYGISYKVFSRIMNNGGEYNGLEFEYYTDMENKVA